MTGVQAQGWPAGPALASRVVLGPQAPRAGAKITMPPLPDSLCRPTPRFVSEGKTAPPPWWFSPGQCSSTQVGVGFPVSVGNRHTCLFLFGFRQGSV